MTTQQRTFLFILFLSVLFVLSFLLSNYMAQRRLRAGYTGQCVVTSCHGLDIACGSTGPEMCTEEYRLGDFCRQFATCGVQDGQCQLIDNPTFQSCKTCVTACEGGSDPEAAFACESKCREQFIGE